MQTEIRRVELAKLDLRLSPLRLCDPAAVKRLRKSVQSDGVRTPVLVSDGVSSGVLVVVDGFKRIQVVGDSGEGEIEVRVVTLDEATAHAALLGCNRPGCRVTDMEEAWVVQSLCRKHKMSQVKVGQLLSRHKSWVCRRLKMVESLVEEVVEDIRLGLLCVSMGRELYRLPRGNQAEAGGCIRKHGLSVRQAARLVAKLLLCEDLEAKRGLLDDPLQYVSADDERSYRLPQDPRLTPQGNELRECLLSIQAKVHRIKLTCRIHAPSGLLPIEADILVPLVENTMEKITQGLEIMQKLSTDSRGNTL